MKKNNSLREIFEDILDGNYENIDIDINIKEYIYEYYTNETIINVKEPVKYIYFLLEGHASIWGEIEWANSIIAYIYPKEILGLIEVLNDVDEYTAFVLAETKCKVLRVPKDIFIDILKNDSNLCYKMLKILGHITAKNMEEANIKKLFSHYDMIGYYFFLQAKHNLPYVCHYTRAQLSEILNINLRTLYRNINLLEENDFLIIKKGKIIITIDNFEKLEDRYRDIII